jgi:hypothetical protein
MVDDNINNNPITNNKPLDYLPLYYLRQAVDHSYPRIKYHPATTFEFAEIIKSY